MLLTWPESPPDVPVAPKLRLSPKMWPMIVLMLPFPLNLTSCPTILVRSLMQRMLLWRLLYIAGLPWKTSSLDEQWRRVEEGLLVLKLVTLLSIG